MLTLYNLWLKLNKSVTLWALTEVKLINKISTPFDRDRRAAKDRRWTQSHDIQQHNAPHTADTPHWPPPPPPNPLTPPQPHPWFSTPPLLTVPVGRGRGDMKALICWPLCCEQLRLCTCCRRSPAHHILAVVHGGFLVTAHGGGAFVEGLTVVFPEDDSIEKRACCIFRQNKTVRIMSQRAGENVRFAEIWAVCISGSNRNNGAIEKGVLSCLTLRYVCYMKGE